MRLARCEGCGRHVRVEDSRCPFCGAAHAAPLPTGNAFVRVSRAAVFAGAAVVGGCWTGSQSASSPPPPPPPDNTQQTFATSPPGDGTGSIGGMLVEKTANQPLVNVAVHAYAPGDFEAGKPASATTTSDSNGHYELTGLAAGTYTVVIDAGPRPRNQVIVRDGERSLVNVHLRASAAVVPHPIPAPYGAPPARRRVV